MRMPRLAKIIHIGLITGGLIASTPFPLVAQVAAPPQEGSGSQRSMPGMMDKEHRPGMRPGMHQHHEQMEKMHQEMSQELQKQLTALREHSKTMEGITDEKQLLTEMKKHQQMADMLLGIMIEQREKMHAQMKAHHEQMHSMKEKPPQSKPQ